LKKKTLSYIDTLTLIALSFIAENTMATSLFIVPTSTGWVLKNESGAILLYVKVDEVEGKKFKKLLSADGKTEMTYHELKLFSGPVITATAFMVQAGLITSPDIVNHLQDYDLHLIDGINQFDKTNNIDKSYTVDQVLVKVDDESSEDVGHVHGQGSSSDVSAAVGT